MQAAANLDNVATTKMTQIYICKQAAGAPLLAVQTAAVLEIVHSLLRLVRSPWHTTLIQVASRVIVLWPYTQSFKESQSHWSLYLMVASWGIVETVRYLFYAAKLVSDDPRAMPYPLFWLRYSLFMVLYPSGISGEVLQILTAFGSSEASPVWPFCLACCIGLSTSHVSFFFCFGSLVPQFKNVSGTTKIPYDH